jgi:hypothetical protein
MKAVGFVLVIIALDTLGMFITSALPLVRSGHATYEQLWHMGLSGSLVAVFGFASYWLFRH